ncbi:hypothetical protein SDC9_83186 [bioreactor metagenome]|uniref:DUF4330 domain-containing protein n=1 Tax=bioreactor metagenome TaxID=1076179 RepID=A0A644Z7I4_9ZZZZ
MKLIDEKGKLFGRLNIIDLLVLLIILVAVAILGSRLLSRQSGVAGTTKLTYTVKVEAVDPEVYDAIKEHIPGQCMASGEMLNAYVTDVKATPSTSGATLSTDSNSVNITTREGLVDLVFTIEADITNTVTNELGTQEIRIGKSHIVKTATFELDNGIITSCVWEKA